MNSVNLSGHGHEIYGKTPNMGRGLWALCSELSIYINYIVDRLYQYINIFFIICVDYILNDVAADILSDIVISGLLKPMVSYDEQFPKMSGALEVGTGQNVGYVF